MQQPEGPYVNANYTYTTNAPQGDSFPSPSFNYRGRSWNNSPHTGGYHGPGSVVIPSPQPHFTSSPGHGSGQGGYPSPQFNDSLGRGSGRGYRSPGPNFRNSPNYGLAQGGYLSSGLNQGRGQWYGNSRSAGSSSGRGKGRWSGQGGGRGGSHNHVSAEDRPDLFYDKSMVEDPWKFLEPVVWKSHKKSWLPHSLSVKKPRVSESPRQQQQSSSQPSLAEILAASFNEAASEKPNVE